MNLMKHRFTAPVFAVLVLALAAFTGSALAGGGNGNGGGSSNGNSANAPGHQTTPAPAAAPAAAPTKPAKQPQASKHSSTSTSGPTTADNSTGVKPSSTTAHGQHNTSAPASSNKTKQYGNGKTAGQIATQAGYGDADLYGPGNSQPHKAAPCPGSKHMVDVHALKNKASKCASSQPAVVTPEVKTDQSATCTTVTRTVTERVLVSSQTKVRGKSALHANAHARKHGDKAQQVWQTVTKTLSVPTGANCESTQPTVVSTQVVSSPTETPAVAVAPATAIAAPAAQANAAGTQATVTPAASSPTATPAAAGGVQGAVVALKPTKTKPTGGVLGATTRLGGTIASTRLPFTGLPLWIFALAAAGLIGAGVAMRRASSNRM
jgi:hypothetical protein